MKITLKIFFTALAVFILLGCGPKPTLNPNYQALKPKYVLVLPPENPTAAANVEEKVYPVIALDRDRIVAIGSLWRAEYGWMRNLGEIRVVVAQDFQRKGLCTILTREIFSML